MPAQGDLNSLLRVTWTSRFGLSQGRDSSQQHARTGGIKLPVTRDLYYLRLGLSQGRSSDSSQQHARTGKWIELSGSDYVRGGLRTARSSMPAQGGVTFFRTCDLDYRVRTKSGEGQLTAACPHRGVNWTIRIGLSQGRSSDSSQQHARTGGHQILSYVKRHLQCAEQQASPCNLTKYCACHAKRHSKI